MKKNRIAFTALLSLIVFTGSHSASASDALMDRDGRTLRVTIDGAETKRTSPKDIDDSEHRKPYTTYWQASASKGPRCFKVFPQDKRLGAPERINILLFEVRPDRPENRWKSYDTVPTPTPADFESEKGYCPSEYTLTDRLRFPTLPPGEYVARIAYWGVGNWDRQDILLTVTE